MRDVVRRRFLGALAGTGVVAAIGGGAALVVDAHEVADYRASADATWRHSEDFELQPPAAARELVRYATLAANSHNTQPWRFRLAERSIAISPDLGRRLASVDPDDHHLFVSLGCATENLIQAAAAFGFRATPVFDRQTGATRIDIDTAPRERSALFDAIPQRQSTRTVYDGRAAPADHLRLLEAAGAGPGVQMLLFTQRQQIEDILGYLIAGNSAQMDDPSFIAELKAWLRFNEAEALRKDDGLFTKCSGNPALPSWLGRLIFNLIVTKDGENALTAKQLHQSAGRSPLGARPVRAVPWRGVASSRSRDALWIRAVAAAFVASSDRADDRG
jgi:hypothetical protein